jgi:tRNA (guanine26-N2/guanine27-N2)-dimethyltransferase
MCDKDEEALEWARLNLENDKLSENVEIIQGDARKEILRQGWHWIDLDPYGSPVPFLDLAMQATARKSVISISATDTAALSGSSPGPLRRRYGARVHMDRLKHDSGLRVLLASAAKAAARHDRVIRPLLSVWDSHHLRITILVERSKMGANAVEENLGWRVASPDDSVVESAIQAGLLPEHDSGSRPMHVMLPMNAYPDLNAGVSGPLWTGPIGDSGLMASMSEAAAEEICKDGDSDGDPGEIKRARQAVRRICDESKAIHGSHLVVTDALPSFVGEGDPPSPSKMAEALREEGFCAEVSRYAEPSFRTDAPWSFVLQAFRRLH